MTTSKQAILGKLNLLNGITPAMAPQLELVFTPSPVIAAGKIDKMGLTLATGFKEPLTEAIRKVMMPSIYKNFDESGRPERWAPLSEATLSIRAWYGNPNSWPLIWTSALWQAASSFGIWTITNAYATVRDLPETVWYGKIHQAGYGGKSMKQRLKDFGGDPKKALESLLDEQVDAIRGGRQMGSGGASPIPARPFMMIQADDEDEITEIFIDWLDKKLEEAWPSGTH